MYDIKQIMQFLALINASPFQFHFSFFNFSINFYDCSITQENDHFFLNFITNFFTFIFMNLLIIILCISFMHRGKKSILFLISRPIYTFLLFTFMASIFFSLSLSLLHINFNWHSSIKWNITWFNWKISWSIKLDKISQ